MTIGFRYVFFSALTGLLCGETTARATNTISINTPAGGTSYSSGAQVTVGGEVDYTWLIDTSPYHVKIRAIDNNGVTTSDLEASVTWANTSSGSFSWPVTMPNPPGEATIIATSLDYYWNELAYNPKGYTILTMIPPGMP